MLIKFFKKKLKYKLDEYLISFHSKIDKTNINLYNTIKGENNIIGNNTKIINTILNNNIKIGNDSYLDNVEYGDFSYNSIRVSIMNCKIGKFCSIAQGVSIGLGKHPLNQFVSTHPSFYSIHKQCGFTFVDQQKFDEMGKTIIGNDVWIGANAIIADDVKIGNGAVVAANSFVNIDVPDYAIVGGTPAKILKYRFSTEEINFLLKLKWWEKDISWLQNNKDLMLDIKLLMDKYNGDY